MSICVPRTGILRAKLFRRPDAIALLFMMEVFQKAFMTSITVKELLDIVPLEFIASLRVISFGIVMTQVYNCAFPLQLWKYSVYSGLFVKQWFHEFCSKFDCLHFCAVS